MYTLQMNNDPTQIYIPFLTFLLLMRQNYWKRAQCGIFWSKLLVGLLAQSTSRHISDYVCRPKRVIFIAYFCSTLKIKQKHLREEF